MSEYIVNVPDEAAECFIARFGLDGTKMMGYNLTGEIVRCRDCAYYDPTDDPSEVYPDRYWCDKLTVYMPRDGFCCFGEWKDNVNDGQ